mgnify:CR=1 FL=1
MRACVHSLELARVLAHNAGRQSATYQLDTACIAKEKDGIGNLVQHVHEIKVI